MLWIASARGLFQFDGVRFERFKPPPGQTLLPHAPNVGMRERAASIGARLTVTSAPGAGTEVVLVLPERSGWSALWRRLVRMGGRDGPDAP